MTMSHSWVRSFLVRWCSFGVAVVAAMFVAGALSEAAPARKAASKRSKTAAKTAKAAAPTKPVPHDLPGMVRAYREAPTPARRSAILAYAASHPKEIALAKLGLGVAAYEQKDYGGAIEVLQPLGTRLPQLSDYIIWYVNAARVERKEFTAVPRELARIYGSPLVSPLRAKAWVLEARALVQSQPAEALRVLTEHGAELPQPAGDLALGEALQASGEMMRAVQAYQRVYLRYPMGEAGVRATAALLALRDAMGSSYPAPDPDAMMRRGDRLVELRDYAHARMEFENLAEQLTGEHRDRARVRLAAIDIWQGQPKVALANLRGLEVSSPDPSAERLCYLAEAYRRLREDDAMIKAVDELSKHHPKSQWRAKALFAAAGRLWMANRPDRYVPYFRAIAQDFPSDPQASFCNWRVVFAAHMNRERSAAEQMREHVRRFPKQNNAATAMYFLGRQAEEEGDRAAARSWYARVAAVLPNSFYGSLARQKLAVPAIAGAGTSVKVEQFLANLPEPSRQAPVVDRTPAVAARAERAKLLRSAGLGDLADAELRFAAVTEGQGWLLATEIAAGAEEPYLGLRAMKALAGDYLAISLDLAPRKLWEPLFPLPWRSDVVASAEGLGLDPYVLAGLIRQESEFNPKAVSRARAYGLTQVLPSTGREFARRAGVPRVTIATLTQPLPNLKLGATILRSLLDRYSGKWELALAGYNAGPSRVAEWLKWNNYREQVEFIESIPITETREYVQAVLRNADMYRRLYGGKDPSLLAARD